MDNTPLFTYNLFKGINNIDKAYRFVLDADVLPSYRPVRYFENVENLDIDNSGMLVNRPGFTNKVTGTFVHSLWASEDLCFFVKAGVLYKLNTDYTSESLGQPIVGKVSYERFNDRIYFTDGATIGYFKDDIVNSISGPNLTYKLALPPGQKLMVHGARLCVASNDVLYIADALSDHYDIRTGYRVFNNRIDIAVSVKTGFYISDKNTWWIQGMIPEEYQKHRVFDVGAIPGTETLINGSAFKETKDGDLAMWVSSEGICVGDTSGKAVNLTKDRYNLSSHGLGTAVVRNVGNTTHFLTSLE